VNGVTFVRRIGCRVLSRPVCQEYWISWFSNDDSAPHVILCCAGSQKLIEDSPTDSYWGCGRDGSGLNMLGVLLMELRATYVRSIALTSTGTVDLLTE
jgi:predicted NAD-dependent protein-ADP-ribosyltransferase YbiA (DUF1768 family)